MTKHERLFAERIEFELPTDLGTLRGGINEIGIKINSYSVEELTQILVELSNAISIAKRNTDLFKIKLDILKAKVFEQSKEESKLSDSRTDNVVTTNEDVISLNTIYSAEKIELEHLYRFYDIHLNILKLKTK